MAEAMAVRRVVSITPNFFEELKRKNRERAEQKQIEKDEKIFQDIRKKIMNKVFEDYKDDIEKNQKQIDEFTRQVNEYRETTNVATDAINNALGAAGSNESLKYNKKMNKIALATTVGTGVSAMVASLIDSGAITQSFATNILQCLSPATALSFASSFFTPPLVGPLVCIGVPVLVATAKFIVNKHFGKKANVGNSADYVGKMEEAVKQWELINKQLAELNQILINDKAELTQLYKENKSKKNKNALLDDYINIKLMPKLTELGVFDGSLSIANYFKKEFVLDNQQLEQESTEKVEETIENEEENEAEEIEIEEEIEEENEAEEGSELDELKKILEDQEIQRT